MNKTILTLLIGGAVVGGGIYLYSASRDARDNALLTIEGTNLEGVFQQITFSSSGCTYIEGNGDKQLEGLATIQDVEETCGISDDVIVSSDQFDCAADLCQGGGLPGELKLCSDPSVSFSSSAGGGSCTVSGGCTVSINGVQTDITGSYQMTASEYTNLQDTCGTSGSSYDTCMAYGCAGVGIADNGLFGNAEPEKEEDTSGGNGTNTISTPTQNNTSR